MMVKNIWMKGNGLIAFLLIGIVALMCVMSLLMFESQEALFAVLITIAIVWIVIKRFGLSQASSVFVTRSPKVVLSLVTIGVLFLLYFFREEHYALLMIGSVLLYTAACTGLNIQTGFAGLANFAGAAFFASGGYTVAVLVKYTSVPSIIAVILGGLVASLMGMILLLPVLRTRGYYSALVTIAFGVLFSSFLQVNESLGGAQGIQIDSISFFGWDMSEGFEWYGSDVSFYFMYCIVALIIFLLAFWLSRVLEWSVIGVNIDATRSDELVSSTFGINLKRWKISAFLLGNFTIGIAGAVYSCMTGFVSPSGATFEQSLLLISIIVLGGIGNMWGALVAAVFVLILPEKLQSLQEYRVLIFSLLVVLILLFSPKGLIPRKIRNFSDMIGERK